MHVLLVLSDTGQVWVVWAVMCLCDAGGDPEGNKVIPVLIWQSQSPLWDLQGRGAAIHTSLDYSALNS